MWIRNQIVCIGWNSQNYFRDRSVNPKKLFKDFKGTLKVIILINNFSAFIITLSINSVELSGVENDLLPRTYLSADLAMRGGTVTTHASQNLPIVGR